jgi:branched-chain amino acid transport system ATP-binding protein
MLEVRALHAGFGRLPVLRDVSVSLPGGRIVGLLGPNGAGKTTLLRAICGLATVHSGTIVFDGVDVTGRAAQDLVRLGLVLVPQGRLLFGEMTVAENLELGAYLARDRGEAAARLRRVHELFPILRERSAQPAALLSGGEQQMLAVGRALMSRPRCLLLDEPSIGLAPKIFDRILAVIDEINADGIPILIAEQNARKILRVAHDCYVLENGCVALEGRSRDLAGDQRVRDLYLGAA